MTMTKERDIRDFSKANLKSITTSDSQIHNRACEQLKDPANVNQDTHSFESISKILFGI